MLQTWLEVVLDAFARLWDGFLGVIPELLAAFIVLVIGWAIAALVGGLVARLIKVLWIEKAIDKLRITDAVSKLGVKLDFSGLIGWLVKWFLIIVFFIAASDILGLSQITEFLN